MSTSKANNEVGTNVANAVLKIIIPRLIINIWLECFFFIIITNLKMKKRYTCLYFLIYTPRQLLLHEYSYIADDYKYE